MAASEKREYKSEAIAKRQLVQWQKKGCRVTRRKNALYIQKTWRKGKGGREVDMFRSLARFDTEGFKE
tara:strand:- start:46 stop:249 length:204 start_codon:yes stop_codon:yes gene_type:complete